MTNRLNLVSAGFVRRKDLDFTDDGSSFRGYDYKGLPITYCKYMDKYYVSVRVDYQEHFFTWKDWMKTDEYRLADEFNGTSNVDVEKLKANCEAIIKKVAELDAEVNNEVIDTKPLKDELLKEIEYGDNIISSFKKNFKWWEVEKFKLNRLVDHLNSAICMVERASSLYHNFDLLRTIDVRTYKQRFDEYGYIVIKQNDEFYFNDLIEAMS